VNKEKSDTEPELMKICRGCGGRVPMSVLVPCPLCNGSKGFALDGGIFENPTIIKAENKEKPQTTSTNESEELERLTKENTRLKTKLKHSAIIREEVQKIQDESTKPKKKEKKKSNKELAEEYNREHFPEEVKTEIKDNKSKKKEKKKSNKELAEEYNREHYGV